MDQINMGFLRTVLAKIEDCTTPIQLRNILDRYKPYLYNGQIQEAFENRLEVVKAMSIDSFTDDKCEELAEHLELETQIASTCSVLTIPASRTTNKKGRKRDEPLQSLSKISINLELETSEGNIITDTLSYLVKIALEKALGKKKEAARLLGMDYKELTLRMRQERGLQKYSKAVKKKVKNSDIVKKF